MQSQEYELIAFEAGDFKDQNNNTWCNIAFLGVSEPLRMVVKDPMAYQKGQKLYGHIEEKTSQAGKPYMRFYRDQRPDKQSFTPSASPAIQGQTSLAQTSDRQPFTADPNKQADIKAEWAIGKVIESIGITDIEVIEMKAKQLYAMVDRVKGSLPKAKVVVPTPTPVKQPSAQQPRPQVMPHFDDSNDSMNGLDIEAGLRVDNIDPNELNGLFGDE